MVPPPDPAPPADPAARRPPVRWTALSPWLAVVAVGAVGLTRPEIAWRATFAVLLPLTAAVAGWRHLRAAGRRDRLVADLARHLRRGTAPPPPLLDPGDEEEAELTAAVRAAAARRRGIEMAMVTLAEDRDRLFAALEGMGEGVIAVGRDERVLLANRAAADLLHLPDGDLTGRPVWEVARRSAVRDAVRAVLRGAGRHEAEFPRPTRGPDDGGTLALRADPLPGVAVLGTRDGGAGAGGVVLQLRDVTELRRLEAVRREFVSNVSHELKTPVAAISALAETLLDGALDRPDVARRFVADIEAQADRLHRLVVDVIRLARVESGRDLFDVRRVAVGPVAENSVREHRPAADRAGVRLELTPPPDPAFVPADPDALATVFDNLLDNALRHTPRGGRVTVEWAAGPNPGGPGGTVLLRVRDTGVGIPAEHRERVFERFHRVDPDRSRETGGTGLGLAIVRQLCDMFGGSVAVDGAEGGRVDLHRHAAGGLTDAAFGSRGDRRS